MIGGCYATFGGMLPPAAVGEIYGDPQKVTAGRSGRAASPSRSTAGTG